MAAIRTQCNVLRQRGPVDRDPLGPPLGTLHSSAALSRLVVRACIAARRGLEGDDSKITIARHRPRAGRIGPDLDGFQCGHVTGLGKLGDRSQLGAEARMVSADKPGRGRQDAHCGSFRSLGATPMRGRAPGLPRGRRRCGGILARLGDRGGRDERGWTNPPHIGVISSGPSSPTR